MKSPVLYFFLLVLQVFFYFSPDIINEYGRFSKILLKKNLELVLCKEKNLVLLNLSLVLLLAKVYPILEKQGYKRDAFMAPDTSCIKIILILLIKIITLYI